MSVVAINLGCGNTISPNYINYDNSPNLLLSRIPGLRPLLYRLGVIKKVHLDVVWPKEIKYLQIHKGLPHKKNSLDYIYTSHFLEHITREQCKFILTCCYECLKPGGTIRVVSPDLVLFVNKYLDAKKNHVDTAADLFMEETFMMHTRAPHLWRYDYESMATLLKTIGFTNITKQSYRQGKCLDINILDNRPEDSYFIEASK